LPLTTSGAPVAANPSLAAAIRCRNHPRFSSECDEMRVERSHEQAVTVDGEPGSPCRSRPAPGADAGSAVLAGRASTAHA
jgi:hypothetical protein